MKLCMWFLHQVLHVYLVPLLYYSLQYTSKSNQRLMPLFQYRACSRALCILHLCILQLSACNNELVRMSQVCKLNHLKILNLSNNNIEFMDGLKELKLLSWLGLANNKIKSIQQLNQCVHLEHLDLSGNFIQHLSDLSYLKNLKVLLLHRNNVETLRGCDRFFPSSVSTLTINGNDLTDLTEVSYLTGLPSMEQLTLADNPCILQPEDESKQFDYRPYVINWCLGLRVLDGIIVGAKERYYVFSRCYQLYKLVPLGKGLSCIMKYSCKVRNRSA